MDRDTSRTPKTRDTTRREHRYEGKAGRVDLDDPATTVAPVKLNAVVGVKGSASLNDVRFKGHHILFQFPYFSELIGT